MREIAELNAKINLLLAMNSISSAELSRRDDEITRLNEELAQRDKNSASSNAELSRRNGELARLNEELAQQDKNCATLNEILIERGRELVHFTEELACTNEALTLKEREALDLSDRLAVLQNKLAESQLASEALQSESSRLVGSLRAELVQRSEEILQLNHELAHKDTALAKKTAEAAELNDQLATLDKSLDDLRLVNAAFRSSTSWRLTAPFRSAIELLKKQF